MTTLTAMPKYEAYKDSGVEWIGEIPEHWELRRLKYLAKLESGETIKPESFTDEGYPVYGGNGFRGFTNKYTNEGFFPLIGRQGALCGNVNYADGQFYASEHAVVVYSFGDIDPYWLGESIRLADFNRLSQSSAQPGISVNVVKNEWFPFPPVEERKLISEFIRRKSLQLDEAIAIKEKQIELLKERKQIIIQQAVTQGLDSTVSMKDSGVEWIGMIPAHWEIKKIKHLGYIYSGDAIVNNQLSDEGLYEVFGGNGLMGFCDKFNVTDDCIIIGRVGALCGNIRLINERKWISDNALILKLNIGVNYKYIAEILVVADLNKLNTSNAQPLITGTKVLNHYVPIAPVSEQQSICNFIELIKTKYYKSEKLLDKQMVKLKEYKNTLINSAVTGKIKVV